MKTKMKLHEIIKINDKGTDSILIELLIPYKRSLNTYYSDLFPSDPVLMVTDVFNASQYGIIVPSGEFHEAMSIYLDGSELNKEDREMEEEVISFNSIPLSKL